MCGWCVYVRFNLSRATHPTDVSHSLSLVKYTDRKLCKGELRCVFIFFHLPLHTFFLYQIYFFLYEFFQIFFLFGKFHFSMCVVAVKAVFRIGREETIACLLLWKIEKNLYFFFSAPWGQHNIILTHFSPKKSFFSSPIQKLFFPHNIFFSPSVY